MTNVKPRNAVLLTERQKAQELQCSVSFLRKDRMRDTPVVPYEKIGNMIRYYPTAADMRLDEVSS